MTKLPPPNMPSPTAAPSKAPNLHGGEKATCGVALLLIDVINDLDFPEGEQLLQWALPMARRIAELRRRAAQCGVPLIYANDNFGRWRSDFRAQIQHCLEGGVIGRPIAELLVPGPHDYFVLKPRHSAFYCTTLELLLKHLGVRTLILAGLAGNQCVLFTASDAYLREFRLIVPRDCVASNTEAENEQSLRHMEQVLKADIRPEGDLTDERLNRLAKG
ncbi:MAG TPA: isochorismatase family cysteine hydrolase [Planctomycetaceae bacterium]|nr:isochorismatase family cysteine hydrolase [Planctomycetaceae bacterium]